MFKFLQTSRNSWNYELWTNLELLFICLSQIKFTNICVAENPLRLLKVIWMFPFFINLLLKNSISKLEFSYIIHFFQEPPFTKHYCGSNFIYSWEFVKERKIVFTSARYKVTITICKMLNLSNPFFRKLLCKSTCSHPKLSSREISWILLFLYEMRAVVQRKPTITTGGMV